MSNFGEKASEHIRRLSVLLRLQENCLIICRFSHYTAAVLAEELTGGGSNTFKTFLVLVSGWKKSLQGGVFFGVYVASGMYNVPLECWVLPIHTPLPVSGSLCL